MTIVSKSSKPYGEYYLLELSKVMDTLQIVLYL